MRSCPALAASLLLLATAAVRGEADVLVTCGSLVKLMHTTGFALHSHKVAYGTGSGQQSVTGYKDGEDDNDFWIVKSPEDEDCRQGTPLKTGSRIRLFHTATGSWLHSHHFPSPLTAQQEISAFGSPTDSDHLDVWKVGLEKGRSSWARDTKVTLQHEETGTFLGLSGKQFGRPIQGQAEVCGKGKADWWSTTVGVYFPPQPEDPSEAKCATH